MLWKDDILEGKAYWCWLYEPDTKFVPQWSLWLVPDESSQLFFSTVGYKTRMEQVEGKDVGIAILINRRSENAKRPLLFDKDKKPLQLYKELPNGSNVKVKYETWRRTHPYTNELHKGIALQALMLLNEPPSIF